MSRDIEDVFPVDAEYAELYARMTAAGKALAARGDAVIVGIARNATPYLANTLFLCEEAQPQFKSCRMYVYENDSTDETPSVLDVFAASNDWFTVQHDTLGVEDTRGFEPDRTVRLAKCRNRCLEWVRANASDACWVIVLDLDPHGGFSPDGIFNSIAWLDSLGAGAMASFSLYIKESEEGKAPGIAQYDAWAMRPMSWWRDRREEVGFGWASMYLPPVGAPPAPFNSAFGGLCVYDAKAILAPGVSYAGGDCEHVHLHRTMKDAGHQLYLNPGSRYIAYWQ